jgi:hypothetical protein
VYRYSFLLKQSSPDYCVKSKANVFSFTFVNFSIHTLSFF